MSHLNAKERQRRAGLAPVPQRRSRRSSHPTPGCSAHSHFAPTWHRLWQRVEGSGSAGHNRSSGGLSTLHSWALLVFYCCCRFYWFKNHKLNLSQFWKSEIFQSSCQQSCASSGGSGGQSVSLSPILAHGPFLHPPSTAGKASSCPPSSASLFFILGPWLLCHLHPHNSSRIISLV